MGIETIISKILRRQIELKKKHSKLKNGENLREIQWKGKLLHCETCPQNINNIILKIKLIYRACHPKPAETFSFQRQTEHSHNDLLGHQSCLKKIQKAENMQRTFSYHNSLKQEIKSCSQSKKKEEKTPIWL